MKKFQILFDVRYSNGEITLEAEDFQDARKQFNEMEGQQLREHCEDVNVDLMNVFDVTDG